MGVLEKFSLKGKSAIVTGVSCGLGVAFTEALAEAGADVLIVARREEKLVKNAEAISKATGRRIVPLRADVSVEEDVARMIKAAGEAFGRVDILINNAGVASQGSSVDMTKTDWDNVIAVNLTGSFLCARHAIKDMVAKRVHGSIINVASIYGMCGDIFPAAPYYASKGAIVNLTRALAVEYAANGIRVNAIAPGFFPSEMTEEALRDKEMTSYIDSRTPLGRPGAPDELKGAAVYLASEASSYVTGHTLPVDGGWMAK